MHHPDMHFKLPCQADHIGHRGHRIDVTAFKKTGDQANSCLGRQWPFSMRDQTVATFFQILYRRIDQLNSVDQSQRFGTLTKRTK